MMLDDSVLGRASNNDTEAKALFWCGNPVRVTGCGPWRKYPKAKDISAR